MSSWVNCGAKVAGARVRSKRALRDAVTSGVPVAWDMTAMFVAEGSDPPSDPAALERYLAEGRVLSVVGPDPYHDRRWYAAVRLRGSRVVVE